MKREHNTNHSSSGSSSKPPMWPCDVDDELFAVLGYSVKPSDMADVAQKIEHLEQVMCSVENDGLSQLASDTTHYNPFDLSSWLESMISGLNPAPDFDSDVNRMVVDSDLTAIPGKAVYPNPRAKPPSPAKKLKLSPRETESSWWRIWRGEEGIVELASDSGESQPDLGYLLEASDDELRIPPPAASLARKELVRVRRRVLGDEWLKNLN